MADGSGDREFWNAQAELAKQVTRLAEQVGSVSAQLGDRVRHKELMEEFSGFRREFGVKLDHMEVKFDQAAKGVETSLERAVDRFKENLGSATDKAVDQALSRRRQQEADAMSAMKKTDEELERKVRNAQRNSVFGIGIGIAGVALAIAKSMGWVQ